MRDRYEPRSDERDRGGSCEGSIGSRGGSSDHDRNEEREPIDRLLDAGRVIALNFPIAMNPGLPRIIGVMLKLDFQRAVLQRIPKTSAQPERVWRDLVFVCDEYHAFATVVETDRTGDERTFALSRQARLIIWRTECYEQQVRSLTPQTTLLRLAAGGTPRRPLPATAAWLRTPNLHADNE